MRVRDSQHRCCSAAGGQTILYETLDAGATWSPARVVGTLEPYDAALGPGPFSVSLINDTITAGVDWKSSPRVPPKPGGPMPWHNWHTSINPALVVSISRHHGSMLVLQL